MPILTTKLSSFMETHLQQQYKAISFDCVSISVPPPEYKDQA